MYHKHSQIKYRRWIIILSVAFLINILIAVGRGVIFFNMQQYLQDHTHVSMTLNETDHLLLYDQILTDLAFLHAYSGDEKHKTEYEKYAKELKQAISDIKNELERIAKTSRYRQTWFFEDKQDEIDAQRAIDLIETVDLNNNDLVALKERSFELVSQKKNVAALQMLGGTEYGNYKQHYRENILEIIKHAKDLIARDNYNTANQSSVMIVVTVTSISVLILIWIFSIRAIVRWKNEQIAYEHDLFDARVEMERQIILQTKELTQANQKLRDLNENLEKRVHDRTQELIEANHEYSLLNESLERQVHERTAKLQEMNDEFRVLNETLVQNIEEEVKSSREKDVLLIQQSRLAAMGEMIGNIAHQWRQPINALNLTLGNILDAQECGDLTEDYLKQQIDKSNRLIKTMSSTIDDFRNFFKSEDSKEDFDILVALREALSIVEASFKHHRIQLNLQVVDSLQTIGFPGQYRQVLLNILSNAKDALLERGIPNAQIWISIERENEWAVVKIRDNAGGIQDSIIEKVFDPYFTTRPHGNGIGLYMSKMIIENNMQGTLSVKNEESGAEFTVQTLLSSHSQGKKNGC